MPWGENFRRFTEIVQGGDAKVYNAISERFHAIGGHATGEGNDDTLLGQAIDYVTNPPPHPMDDTEYNDILEGDQIWASIQTNSGK